MGHLKEKFTTALCTYRVRAGAETQFIALLEKHWPALHGAGLVTDVPSMIWRGEDEDGKTFFFEILEWKNLEAPEIAHKTPAVMAVWEPMGGLCEARNGRPPMEFPHGERLKMSFERK